MKIYNMFHVSLLKPCRKTNANNVQPLLIEIKSEEQYKVEEILDSRIYYGKLQYLVKWMGYPHTNN